MEPVTLGKLNSKSKNYTILTQMLNFVHWGGNVAEKVDLRKSKASSPHTVGGI